MHGSRCIVSTISPWGQCSTAKTGKVYIGQTSEILSRFGEHVVNKVVKDNGGLDFIEFLEVPGGKLAREVAEQRLIEKHGLDNLLNQRNAIGRARKHLMSRFPE